MHEPIRDRLEDLLRDRGYPSVAGHLANCAECSSELDAMKQQSSLLGTLRGPEMEPAAGFYARVMQRIEESEIGSFWSFFVESQFSRRLAYASLTIAVVLGTYVVTQESREHNRVDTAAVALNGKAHYDALVMGDQTEQRDAVLENFAVHLRPASQGQIQ
ncbi:MAG TPA: hypothetical protein VKX25_14845 [Bryobacteraceae bacterium]|jgi:hypothetical protein|nr:hypothetical protein [Bryobacteraceae bacterium]